MTGYENGKPVAAARIFFESPGVCHIGRVCVLKETRGRHYGEALMKEAVAKGVSLGAEKFVLGAQKHAAGFYEKLGFIICGPQFDDEGCPHVPMELIAEKE